MTIDENKIREMVREELQEFLKRQDMENNNGLPEILPGSVVIN